MKVHPDTSIRIANSETVSLELDSDVTLSQARLYLRSGDVVAVDLADNTFDFPIFAAPTTVKIGWFESSSDDAVFTSYAEVVSRHYFTLEQLSGFDGGRDDFGDLPIEMQYAARQAATEVFEEASGRSFVARIGRTKDYGRSSLLVLDHHDIRELLTPGYVQVSDSQLERRPGCGPFPRWVEYVYGAPVMPAEVSRAVLELAAYTLRPSNRPIGATGESTDAGYIHYTIAGRDGATAIPEVNAAIQQFGAGEHYVW
ncbi:MAG: hypothetical protein IJ111_02075 [Eggerthellaceae bacterium]|nr:hypothetical protein [Eggerthellaceae bacterium]